MADWYQIENEQFLVQITSAGAEMKSMFAKTWNRELLWVPVGDAAKKIWNRTSPILFPIVGKLKEDSYRFKNQLYPMSQHGFARDKKFQCISNSAAEVEFLLLADSETLKIYPFHFELRARFCLIGNKLNVSYLVKNIDQQDIFFSIGAHPAFATMDLKNYEIQFEKSENCYFQLKNGYVNWEQDYRLQSKTLTPSQEMFIADALVFKNIQSAYVDLVDKRRKEVIRLHGSSTPFMGIWGKGSVPFICLELEFPRVSGHTQCQAA